MVRVDLHTHSEASKDGGITPEQYAQLLKDEKLDLIAITDHDRIDFAKGMQKALGADKIIIGQEITTLEGDIIGLYLTKVIPAGLTAQESVAHIKQQGGLVYIPHPFESVRKGVSEATLEVIIEHVDIMETCNGRAFFENRGPKAKEWAKKFDIVTCSSSDAHTVRGAGRTYTVLGSRPTKQNLLKSLQNGKHHCKRPPFYTLLAPKYNRIKHFVKGRA